MREMCGRKSVGCVVVWFCVCFSFTSGGVTELNIRVFTQAHTAKPLSAPWNLALSPVALVHHRVDRSSQLSGKTHSRTHRKDPRK